MTRDLRSRLNEDNTRDRLFHPHMRERDYPSADQVGATQYDQQGYLESGIFDGCYLLDGRPMVLVELKREGLLRNLPELEKAQAQVTAYALADDFEVPPPYILMSDGAVFEMYERTSLSPDAPNYQPLPRLLTWAEVRKQTPGQYTARFVSLRELVRLFRDYVKMIEDEIRVQVLRLSEAATRGMTTLRVQGREFGWAEIEAVGGLLDAKMAAATTEDTKARTKQAVNELTAAAALNYVNKVFFLKYCEDRHLEGLFRILQEIEIDPVAGPKQAAYAATFISLLKRRISCAAEWTDKAEAEYRELIQQLKTGVLDRRSWFEIVHAAFLVAEQSFPVIYRPNAYDYLCPTDTTIVDMLCELRTKDFSVLDQEMVGSIYQAILRNEQYRQKVLGAFYTPPKTVAYMVSRLGLEREHVTLEPACGSGHFVEELCREYLRLWEEGGYEESEAAGEIISKHIIAFDIDDFAAQLAAMRLFFLFQEPVDIVPNIFVRDTLDMNVGAGQAAFFDADGHTIFDDIESIDPRAKLSHADALDSVQFDRIVGNPPYGGKPTSTRQEAYRRLYRQPPGVYGQSLGSNDTFGFFIANAIQRVKEGGVICLIVSDSFLSIATHTQLRSLILSTCKIREILLAPVDLFRPVAIPRTCILTLEKANGNDNAQARRSNSMRLVDRVGTEDEYWAPPKHLVETRRQSDYERVPRNPFFIRVHEDVLACFEKCARSVGDFTEGGAGLQTGDNPGYVALVAGSPEAEEQESRILEREVSGKPEPKRVYRVIGPAEVVDFETTGAPVAGSGFPAEGPHFVPFVRGSSRHQYYAEPDRYVDYSATAVEAYGTSRSARYENVRYYFRRGFVTNAHNKLLRAALVENSVPAVNTNIFVPTAYSVEYFLALVNSRLATYICTKILNTSIGGLSAHPTPEDIRLIPFAEPEATHQAQAEKAVTSILRKKMSDCLADCSDEQALIDHTVYQIYGLSSGAIAAIDAYWEEVLSEQVNSDDACEEAD